MRITMDTNQERAVTVTLQGGKFFKFNECKSGLYYYDTEKKYDKAEENNNTNKIQLLVILVFIPSSKVQTS